MPPRTDLQNIQKGTVAEAESFLNTDPQKRLYKHARALLHTELAMLRVYLPESAGVYNVSKCGCL